MKSCPKCLETKDPSEFYPRKSAVDGRRSRCIECEKTDTRAVGAVNYKKNKERVLANGRAWRQANPTAARDAQLKRIYKIDLDAYNKLLQSQAGRCVLCNRHYDDLSKSLAVDHCHRTGKVRGLLCSPCNRGIGFLQDDPTLCEAAAAYLRGH